MNNETVADTLWQIADLMEIDGANSFRTKAYRKAANTVENMDYSVKSAIAVGILQHEPGIGKSLLAKLTELVTTGKCSYLEDLKKRLPAGLFEMRKIPGLGPKRIKALFKQLSITDVAQLKVACQLGTVATLPRFGKKLQAQILDEIEHLSETATRRPLKEVLPVAEQLRKHFGNLPEALEIAVAGSLRRKKETVKDVDLLVSSNHPDKIMEAAKAYPCQKILASGRTKTSFRLKGGLQVDVRAVKPESFACALAYFTGSKEFNVKLRILALEKGYSLNEYFLRPLDGSTPPTITSEQALHQALGLKYIPPDRRESAKEIVKQLA